MKFVPTALLQKYNQLGPRYTSYPPATHFADEFQLPAEPLPRAPLSLYLHLPFCRNQCLYCGCTNMVTRDQRQSARYLTVLQQEMKLRTPLIDSASKVVQIQLGGGSPTFLLPEEIEQLGRMIRDHFPVSDSAEAGVEIDPRTLTREKVDALRRAGFNRASLGIQDTNPAVQKTIARIQPLEMIEEGMSWLRNSGISSINFDLIYGLPGQSVESFNQTLDDILPFSPDRLALYSYAHIPWIKPHQKNYEARLPDAETKLKILQLIIEKLTAAGYVYIGMDHFAKPDDALAEALKNGTLQRNFQGYSTHKGVDLHGFGMSAISHAGGHYFQNHKELAAYSAALHRGKPPIFRGYTMTREDQIRYHAIMHLMCNLYIDYAELSTELNIDFAEHFKSEIASLDDLEADGLLRREPTGLHITPLGRLFVRIMAMRFDAYLPSANKGRYSQTV